MLTITKLEPGVVKKSIKELMASHERLETLAQKFANTSCEKQLKRMETIIKRLKCTQFESLMIAEIDSNCDEEELAGIAVKELKKAEQGKFKFDEVIHPALKKHITDAKNMKAIAR